MAEIININRARKQRARAASVIKAEENRVRFGRTKAEKQADAAERARVDKLLDESKRD
jgi:ribosomal protein L19E